MTEFFLKLVFRLSRIFDPLPESWCSYEGLDGLKRDTSKLLCEKQAWGEWMAPQFKRWRKEPSFHHTTNLWVEACRASPYYFGHVLMMAMVIFSFIWVGIVGLFAWFFLK